MLFEIFVNIMYNMLPVDIVHDIETNLISCTLMLYNKLPARTHHTETQLLPCLLPVDTIFIMQVGNTCT